VFSNYGELNLTEVVQDAVKPEGEMDEQWFLRETKLTRTIRETMR